MEGHTCCHPLVDHPSVHQQAVLAMPKSGVQWAVLLLSLFLLKQWLVCVLQFYEVDLPHASITKQKLVDKVLPDTAKVPVLPIFRCMIQSASVCILLTIVSAVHDVLSTVSIQSWPATNGHTNIMDAFQQKLGARNDSLCLPSRLV